MVDKVDEAIAAVEAAPPTVEMIQIPVTIASTGRPANVALPVDCTDAELLEFAGWLLTGVAGHFRTQRAKTAGGRIIVPRGSLPS